MAELCITLICPPAAEEKLLDMLLLFDGVSVFSSAQVALHGLLPERLSQAEQVLGRALASEVRLVIADTALQPLRESLQKQFPGAGLRYRISPVMESGEIT